MPIKVACKCGQQFAAKDELAGRMTKCPQCGQPLQIPRPAGKPGAAPAPQAVAAAPARSLMEDLLDEAGVKAEAVDNRPRCPSCKAPMAPNAVLCVQCGLHLETGKQLKGAGSGRGEDVGAAFGLGEEEGHGAAAKSLLVKAQKTIAADQNEEYKIRTQGMPVWAIVVLLGALITFGVTMSLLPANTALKITGVVLILLPSVVALLCNILILVVAFKESVGQGLCCLLIPFYVIYFCATHWEDCGRYFIIAILCNVFSGIGGGVAGVADRFEPAAEQQTIKRGGR